MLGRDGKLYAAMASGNIVRMNPDGSGQEVVRQHRRPRAGLRLRRRRPADRRRCGEGAAGRRARPQGHGADRQGGRRPDPLRRRGGGRAQRQDLLQRRLAPLRARATGAAPSRPRCSTSSSRRRPARILEYDPATRSTRVVVKGLSFANGVALSSDEQTLFVAETGKLPHLEGRRCRAATSTLAAAVAAGQGAARQPARLPRQPDARCRRPHLARLVRPAQPGGRCDGRQALPARADAAPAARAVAAAQALRPRDRLRRETGASWPTCRTRPAPIPRPPASPRPRIASTSRTCTWACWGG